MHANHRKGLRMSKIIGATSSLYLFDDPTERIRSAHNYFDSLGISDVAANLDPNIQDSDGLVSYIAATTNPVPSKMKKLYEEIKPVMEGLTNVVVSSILTKAGTDPAKQHDPDVWREPIQYMTKAFCGGFSEATKHYDQKIRGVEIATKFINILIDAVINQGAALADFTKFLQSQGETMRTQISEGQNSYLYACVSIVHEIFEAPDKTFIYVPKFKSYFTQFTQKTFKISSACASYDSFEFNFDLDIMTGAFMVSSWENSETFRKHVTDFIERFQKTNIEDSANYFDGIFNSDKE